MKKIISNIFILIIISTSILVAYESLDYDFLENKQQSEKKETEKKKNTKKASSFDETIKNLDKIEGLFDFYWDKEKNKCYLSIPSNQLDKIFLLSLTRQTGDGFRYDGSSMLGEFPFSFKKVGNNIQLIAENVKFRAEKDSAIFKAINNSISIL